MQSKLSSGIQINNGILFSEHTLANALAVFPAEATTITFSPPARSRAHTEYASHSLNVPVRISAPRSGQYPLKVTYRFDSPNALPNPSLR